MGLSSLLAPSRAMSRFHTVASWFVIVFVLSPMFVVGGEDTECDGTGLISLDVWRLAKEVDKIVQIAHVPREYTKELFNAFYAILRSGSLEEAIADCPLGLAVLAVHSLPEMEQRFGVDATIEQFVLYERLLRDSGIHSRDDGEIAEPKRSAWKPETHQSAAYSLLLGLKPATCFGLNLKIFVYESDFATKPLTCSQGMFATEVFLHRYLLHSDCRTEDPNEADLFFVPVYAACVMTKEEKKAAEMDEFYKTLVKDGLPHFSRSGGLDHIFLWSSETYDFPSWETFIQRSIFASVEAQPIECTDFDFFSEETADNFGASCKHCPSCFQPWKDFVIPGFVEKWSIRKMHEYERPSTKRIYTACYHGADSDQLAIYAYANTTVRNDLQRLRDHPGLSIGYRFPLISDYFDRIGQCHFCFVPKGLGYWSNRLYEVLFAGCIPVILSDGIGLPFDDLVDWSSFSIKWPMGQVGPSLVRHLENLLATKRTVVNELHDNVLRQRCWFDWNSDEPTCSPYLAILLELNKRKGMLPPWNGRWWRKTYDKA